MSVFGRPVMPMILGFGSLDASAPTSLIGTATPASAIYPTSNLAIYCPVFLQSTIIITKFFAANGTNASNNVDIGIYDFAGTKIVSTGSTARSGTTTIQAIDVTDTTIGPGIFYLALAHNNAAAGAYLRHNFSSVEVLRLYGIFNQASAFPLPATATFATPTSTYVPVFGTATVVTV